MGQALYRKYRSKSLDEIVGQEHIITTLRNALKSGAVSHAYLFTGPRGVGKTSIARILAHEINGLNYTDESAHLDIIEIDAASNRRIDEIRDLRDKVHIAPTSSKYKVYIIDEVHMLTKEAFNALLKTLEEPPAHVIFILATTEVHKLPETIVSRTQRFTFKPIDRQKAVDHLKSIAKSEKIKISDEALGLLADHGDGSFRDSISLLDQASNISDSIEADDIRLMLGIAPAELVEALYTDTFTGTPQSILESLRQAEEKGFEPAHLAKQIAAHARNKLIDGSSDQPLLLVALLRDLIEVPASSDPASNLEVVLIGCNLQTQPQHDVRPATKAVAQAVTPVVAVVADKPVKKVAASPEESTASKKPVIKKPVLESHLEFNKAWPATLDVIKQKYNTLYGVLRMAQPTMNEDTVTLAFKFAFHQKRINDPKNKQLIIELLEHHLGRPVVLNCEVGSTEDQPVFTAEPVEEMSAPLSVEAEIPVEVAAISNIFGGAEVLES